MTLSLSDHRHVHFVGIGGIGMSALARVLLARGYTVSGSDHAAGEQTDALQALGATIHIGHSAGCIEGADLVITTPAAGSASDVAAARAAGITIVRRAEILGAVTNPGRGIAVAGTHGKSTTSGLIGHIAAEAGLDPTVLVGGVVSNFGSNARLGASDLVIVEADEFDAAFLELYPDIAVITSVEPEHLDYFGTVECMENAFRQFARQVTGTLIICADDAPVGDIARGVSMEVISYGIDQGDWRAWRIEERGRTTTFCAGDGTFEGEFTMSLAGAHNVRNALAALAVARTLDISLDVAASALASFTGIGRRFETMGEVAGVLVMDDYAHHPTEIRRTLAALSNRFGRPIRLAFQPHTYSRTSAFLDDFGDAFADAE
ncbi:MAG TPA: UDP-N-acetylmuramate--L-alanine ligase, partial [Chloroflexota bacterium]